MKDRPNKTAECSMMYVAFAIQRNAKLLSAQSIFVMNVLTKSSYRQKGNRLEKETLSVSTRFVYWFCIGVNVCAYSSYQQSSAYIGFIQFEIVMYNQCFGILYSESQSRRDS
jgi:hypothetical protein